MSFSYLLITVLKIYKTFTFNTHPHICAPLSPKDTIHLLNFKSLKDNPICKGDKKPKPMDCEARLELGSR